MEATGTTEKEGGKTSSFKLRRDRVRTEIHSSWIPLWRERRKDCWAEEKRGRRGEEKIKQRVRDTGGVERVKVNMCLAVSTRKMAEPLVECWDEHGCEWMMMVGNRGDGRMVCVCVTVRERVSDVRGHSHLQHSLELLQFGFLLLNLTVVVLAQFNQQQPGDIQYFLQRQRQFSLIWLNTQDPRGWILHHVKNTVSEDGSLKLFWDEGFRQQPTQRIQNNLAHLQLFGLF